MSAIKEAPLYPSLSKSPKVRRSRIESTILMEEMVGEGKSPDQIIEALQEKMGLAYTTAHKYITVFYGDLRKKWSTDEGAGSIIDQHLAMYDHIIKSNIVNPHPSKQDIALKALKQKEELLKLHSPTIVNKHYTTQAVIHLENLTVDDLKEIFKIENVPTDQPLKLPIRGSEGAY
jgi:hypothetical protein